MENTNNNSSTGLFVGIILGILILGGIFLYYRSNNTGTTDTKSDTINITVPVGGGNDGPAGGESKAQ